MKSIYFYFLCCFCFCFSYSQEKKEETIIRVEPNGVVVHKSIGVEQTLNIKPEPTISTTKRETSPKTLDDFSLEELEEMLYYIDLKIENVSDTEDYDESIRNYVRQKGMIEEKIKKIKN